MGSRRLWRDGIPLPSCPERGEQKSEREWGMFGQGSNIGKAPKPKCVGQKLSLQQAAGARINGSGFIIESPDAQSLP